ncbi:MAG: hypothetical protein LBR78_01870 [Holosporales bacterium]|jgi:hypothetical protein|nr:hypothetical protein [Holosporales bacterium]
MQRRVGTLQELLCRYEEREERLRRALNKLRDMVREVRGSSDSVSLTEIEGILDGIARQETLEGLVGEVGSRGSSGTVHQRLTALENATTGVARADVLGTPSPLTGMHLWFTTTMGLVIAQARADEMLSRNCTPEPARSILRGKMMYVTSNLRPDRDTTGGGRVYNFSEYYSGELHDVNTNFTITASRGDWPTIVVSLVTLETPDTTRQILSYEVSGRGAACSSVCVGGRWSVTTGTTPGYGTTTCNSEITADCFLLNGNFHDPGNDVGAATEEQAPYMAYYDAFPNGISFHVIRIG